METLIQTEEIKSLIKALSTKKIVDYFEIPEEYRLNPDIVKLERQLGIRRTLKIGYDALCSAFFAEEVVLVKHDEYEEYYEKTITTHLPNFDSFYEFLEGEIYDNSSYFLYDFSPSEIEKYSLDLTRINKKGFINDQISNYSLGFSKEELEEYQGKETEKIERQKWIQKFINCKSYKEFKRVIESLKKTKYRFDFTFFMHCFILSDNKLIFDILNQYIKDYDNFSIEILLCFLYNPNDVLESYYCKERSELKNKRTKGALKAYIKYISVPPLQKEVQRYYDEHYHFFCEKTTYFFEYNYRITTFQYFDSFEEFTSYLKNDLSSCDLSKAILPHIDFSLYKINNTTKLPIEYQTNIKYSIYKKFDHYSNSFIVNQYWKDENNNILKKCEHTFKYFCDFISFLNFDLSNANLVFCDGLKNLNDFSLFNFENAILTSEILEKLGEKYEPYALKIENHPENSLILKNEIDTNNTLLLQKPEDLEESCHNQINYISDLHLLHRLKNYLIKSNIDLIYALQKIIDDLLKDIQLYGGLLLIVGDTSSDFYIFELFVRQLRYTLLVKRSNLPVIFTLGNHELWSFENDCFDNIVNKYRDVLNNYHMHLLQNEIIYIEDNTINKISANEIQRMSKQKIRNRLIRAKRIIFGGIAFSGKNKNFNANNGIYKKIISREKEIEESKLFHSLYKKVCSALYDKNVIIATHTPKSDWSNNNTLQNGFSYVYGHNHKNYYYTDGTTSIYADNQIGYSAKNPHLKYFYLSDAYDTFSEYKDGIHIITPKEYKEFYYGKRLSLTFNRDINILYMLKKNSHYCFIHQAKDKKLAIFNGGALKRLDKKNINYYYENMDSVISYIKSPLKRYTSLQEKVAKEIKMLGGDGFIHGAIIDIDWKCHVFVNPFDLTLTYYYADDIIEKIVYNSLGGLLKSNNPLLHQNYEKLLQEKNTLILIKKQKRLLDNPDLYLETDIYNASNAIKKMQKLNNNILTFWHEKKSTRSLIE